MIPFGILKWANGWFKIRPSTLMKFLSQLFWKNPTSLINGLLKFFFYLIADINGISLSVFKLLLILCGSFFIGRYYFNKYKEGSWTYPILMISSFFVAFRGELRSELFGTFFSAYLIYRIEKWRDLKSYKVLIPLIPAQIIWANTHGSFLLGPFLVFFYAGAILAGIWFSKLQRDKEEPELPK